MCEVATNFGFEARFTLFCTSATCCSTFWLLTSLQLLEYGLSEIKISCLLYQIASQTWSCPCSLVHCWRILESCSDNKDLPLMSACPNLHTHVNLLQSCPVHFLAIGISAQTLSCGGLTWWAQNHTAAPSP